MAYKKLLSAGEILNEAVQMVEQGRADGLSLRAVAAALGVQAPSLYRYFADKSALELAVAEEALRRMRGKVERAATRPDPKARVAATANAYLGFARDHYALYAYVFQGRIREAYGSAEGKALWNTLLTAVSDVTGKPDDTAATVAIWSFLHGYATLEHAGGFGASGPRGALDLGLHSLMSPSSQTSIAASAERQPKAPATRRRKS